jgi:hypothetical protein
MSKILPIDKKHLKEFPQFSKIWSRYTEINRSHCNFLLNYLYSGTLQDWVNPITTKDLKRESTIVISFLSVCYYNINNWDDGSKVTLNHITLTYKEHVSNFIESTYLYNPAASRSSLAAAKAAKAAKAAARPAGNGRGSNSPPAARNKSISPRASQGSPRAAQGSPRAAQGSPRASQGSPRAAQGSPRAAQGSPRASQGSPRAAQGSPRAAQGSPRAARRNSNSSASSNKLVFSPKNIATTAKSMTKLSVNADKMSESKCTKFVKDVRDAKKGKTPEELKNSNVKILNPVTGSYITSFKSPIIQSYLVKCYFSFDNNEPLKRSIKKIVDIKTLKGLNDTLVKVKKDRDDKQLAEEKAKEAKRLAEEKANEEKRLAEEKAKEEKRLQLPEVTSYIDALIDDFNRCCDELEAACDIKMVNGKQECLLAGRNFIDDVVNAIVVIVFTKYLHLSHFYDNTQFNFNSKMDLKLILYDEKMYDHYVSSSKVSINDQAKQLIDVEDRLIETLSGNYPIIYQHAKMLQYLNNRLIDMRPKTVDTYHLNTLFNRQYEFDIYKNVNETVLTYNRINVLDTRIVQVPFSKLDFPHTLGYAKKIFEYRPFNYGITNSTLPKHFVISTKNPSFAAVNRPFNDIVNAINARLKTLPVITGFKDDLTVKKNDWEVIVKLMKDNSFGDNTTGYGSKDMIRKNILYSLNAQNPTFITIHQRRYRTNFFYNSEYTGTFPLFTWIPLNREKAGDIYNFPSFSKWQPYGVIYNDTFVDVGNAYKNYGVSPWSKQLNETIYNVITDKLKSVAGLASPQEVSRMTRRVNDTLGIYKDMPLDPLYKNNKVYLYHGTRNRLHTIKDRDLNIEILGFLSTSQNVYTASYYSGIGVHDNGFHDNGFIYIIEADDSQKYINLNDELYQILILPYSVIRLLAAFSYGTLTVIICRLITTPTNTKNNYLHSKLLDIPQPAGADGAAGAAGKSDSPLKNLKGGIGTLKQIMEAKKGTKKGTENWKTLKASNMRPQNSPEHKNIIYPKADMRKVGDMPEDIRKYYGLTKERDDKMVDINNGCHFRIL